MSSSATASSDPTASSTPLQLADAIAWLDEALAGVARAAWKLRGAADEVMKAERQGLRLGAAGTALGRIVIDYRLYSVYSAFLGAKTREATLDRIHDRSARKFREVCVRQRGGLVKVGQLLSARPDVLPPVWVRELATLQDDVPAEPFAGIQAVLEADLGAPLGQLFEQFDETPFAAASIGQVHRAVTRAGQVVAVKVQRPGIGELFELDLGLLETVLGAMRSALPPTDYDTIAAEVRDAVVRELDYAREAASADRVAGDLGGMLGVIVPRPIRELCGARVLTTPYVSGEKLTVALDRLAEAGDTSAIADLLGRLLEVYLRQILVHGFYQADPHPGNFLVTPAGDLVLLDFGCARELAPAARRDYAGLILDVIGGDMASAGARLGRLGFATRSGKTDTLEGFAQAMLARFRDAATSGGGVAWPTRDQLLTDAAALLQAAHADPVTRVPADFVMIGRVLGTLGGLFGHHKPNIDFARRVLPHLVG